jgi:hypothetical protein
VVGGSFKLTSSRNVSRRMLQILIPNNDYFQNLNCREIYKERIDRHIEVYTKFLVRRNDPFLINSKNNHSKPLFINISEEAKFRQCGFYKININFYDSRKECRKYGCEFKTRRIPKLDIKWNIIRNVIYWKFKINQRLFMVGSTSKRNTLLMICVFEPDFGDYLNSLKDLYLWFL